MTITVTFEALSEMKEFANQILAGELNKEPAVTQTKSKQVDEPKKVEEKIEPKAEEEPKDLPFNYTLEDVRAKFKELMGNGKRDAVQQIIKSYGVDKLTAIDASHYAEIMQKAGDL